MTTNPEPAPESGAPRSREQALDQLDELPLDVTEDDVRIYRLITSTVLSPEQAERIRTPVQVYPKQQNILAVHWHPEFIPMELIRERIDATFPGARDQLIIPTQHNELESYDGQYTGVEIDCYSESFQRKVQLLFHFSSAQLDHRADVFRSMLEHTRKYRQSQLFDFIDTFLNPRHEGRLDKACRNTGADERLVEFTRIHVNRIKQLIDRFEAETPKQMIKNKILRNYFDTLRDRFDDRLINHVQLFLKAVKKRVKRDFALDYFYRTEEVIEEGRRLGACIVIPHPEQFWPILLDDLAIDAIEVWNPQSLEYTPFLIDVVNRQNQTRKHRDRPVLVTMGDDCHMGEKVKEPRYQDPAKARREIGWQPPWEDLNIRKKLIVANASRAHVIQQYKERLG